MEALNRGLVLVYRVTSVALLAALIAVLFAAIVLREAFNTPIVWAIEVSLTLFVWIVFLGAGLAMAQNAHIRLSLLVELMPPRLQALTGMLVTYIGFALLVALWWSGLEIAWNFRGHRFTTLDIGAWWTWLAFPVGLTLMITAWIEFGQWTWRPRNGKDCASADAAASATPRGDGDDGF